MANIDWSAWYWNITGTGIYSSATGAIVPDDNLDYTAWLATGNIAGATDAETLDQVLTRHGLPPTGIASDSLKKWLLSYANLKITALLAVSRHYIIANGLTVTSDATPNTGVNLLSLYAWGAANPDATQRWVSNEIEAPITLTGAQFQLLSLAVEAYGASVWNIMATAADSITSGTITTPDEIDALSWPT